MSSVQNIIFGYSDYTFCHSFTSFNIEFFLLCKYVSHRFNMPIAHQLGCTLVSIRFTMLERKYTYGISQQALHYLDMVSFCALCSLLIQTAGDILKWSPLWHSWLTCYCLVSRCLNPRRLSSRTVPEEERGHPSTDWEFSFAINHVRPIWSVWRDERACWIFSK